MIITGCGNNKNNNTIYKPTVKDQVNMAIVSSTVLGGYHTNNKIELSFTDSVYIMNNGYDVCCINLK